MSKWSPETIAPSRLASPTLPHLRFPKVTITGAAASREVIFSHREIHPSQQQQHHHTQHDHHVPTVCVLRLWAAVGTNPTMYQR